TPSSEAPPAAEGHPVVESQKPALVSGLLPETIPPVNARGAALTILTGIAFVFTLQWAREFFIPLTFGILIAYTLNPLVIWLERRKIPRVVGTRLAMLALFGSATMIFTSVYTQAEAIVDELPIATYKQNSALSAASTGER